MRSVSPSLETWLDTHTVGIFRHLVIITARTGPSAYWTDHETDLVYGAHTYLAGGTGTVPLITWGQRDEFAGTTIGSLEMTLLCGTTAEFQGVRLPLAATQRMLDGARVDVFRVFGESTIDMSLGALGLFEGGIVMEARPSSAAVELEIECGLAALNVEIPRRPIRPSCQNILFDTQCGLSKATYTASATVGSGTITGTVVPSNLTAATGYYNLGVVEFTAGTTTVALRGVRRAVRDYSNTNGTVTLDRALPATPASGDTFTVYPGCPKTVTACKTKFASDNSARYRGFPFIPREDFGSAVELDRWFQSRGTYSTSDQWGTGDYWIRVPDSAYGGVIPIVYGKQRIEGRTIWRGMNTSTNPERAFVLEALCEGTITSIPRYWENDRVYDTTYPYGATSLLTGTRPTQTPWSILQGPAVLGYPGVAGIGYLATLANGRVPRFRWEVCAKLYNTGGSDGDADPAQIIQDLFPDSFYGAAFPFSIVTAIGLDGNASSSYARYVSQAEMWLSPAITERRPAIDILEELCAATNAEPLWKEGQLWIVPLADTATGTYSPVLDVRYNFAADDLIPGDGDLVRVTIEPETETYNVCPVVFTERYPDGASNDGTLEYQTADEMDPDPVDVSERGERHAPAVTFSAITRRPHAVKLSRILAQRQVRTRQEIEFSTGFRFSRLEPLDLVTVTDTLFPYTQQPFQVREIREDMRTGVLTVTGREWTAGVNHATAHVTQSSDGATSQWAMYDADARIHEAAARNWTNAYSASANLRGLAYNGTRMVAVGITSSCVTSENGETWTSRTIPAGSYYDVTWASSLSLFVAVGPGVAATSPDGITWTARTIPGSPNSYYSVVWSGSRLVAIGSYALCATSDDGINWTARTIPAGNYYAATWGGEVFVATGGGVCATSPDGITWTSRTIPSGDYDAVDANPDGSSIVAVGASSKCAISYNQGTTWSAVTLPADVGTRTFVAIKHTGTVFVAISSVSAGVPTVLMTSRRGDLWVSHSVLAPWELDANSKLIMASNALWGAGSGGIVHSAAF